MVALVPGGGYAEFCTVDESNALSLPELLSFVEGAGIPETTFTVWHNVFQRGRLSRGEWLLVHGGTSGIGTTAIQLRESFWRIRGHQVRLRTSRSCTRSAGAPRR